MAGNRRYKKEGPDPNQLKVKISNKRSKLILQSRKIHFFTGLPGKPSHKFGFRSSVQKNGLPGEGRHEGLVTRNDVLTSGFI